MYEKLMQILMKFSGLNFGTKVLSVFGKELLNDIKRNSDIFKDDEEFKNRILEIRRQNEERD